MKRSEFRRILEGMGLVLSTTRVLCVGDPVVIDHIGVKIEGTHYLTPCARVEGNVVETWNNSRNVLIRAGLQLDEIEDVMNLIKEYAAGDPAEREEQNDKTTAKN